MRPFPLYLQRLLHESVRFFALLSVGLAWAVVPYVAVFLRHDPRFLLEPRLLAFLSRVDILLIVMTPVLALFGLAIVSRLMFVGAKLDETSAIAVFLVTGGVLLLPMVVAPSWDSTSMALTVVAAGGVVVTAIALWRRSWMVALIWVLAVALPLFVLLTTTDTQSFDDPEMIAGMRVFVLWTFTLVAIHIGAVVAFVWPARTESATT